MRLLFVHQNFPGQFLHLAPRLARLGHEVAALSARAEDVSLPGVKIHRYILSDKKLPGTHPLLQRFERARNYGESAALAALELNRAGFVPDLIIAHPGWGETLFLQDVWPKARQLHYCEFHFAPYGPLQVFDPTPPLTLSQAFGARLHAGQNLFAIDAMDRGYAPMQWQRDRYPEHARERIAVVHDGINAGICRPNPDATIRLPSGRQLTRRDKVVTYVARSLEPVRGFPEFMRAMELLLSRRRDIEVVIVGADEVSYGGSHQSGRPWREAILEELDIDRSRLHFLGRIPYEAYLAVLQTSTVHVYLTVPFVLSWSALEAMAVGCVLVASNTEPVREVVTDGENGLCFDFFDRTMLVERIEECLTNPEKFEPLRENARATIVAKYALSRCLPQQIALVELLARQSR